MKGLADWDDMSLRYEAANQFIGVLQRALRELEWIKDFYDFEKALIRERMSKEQTEEDMCETCESCMKERETAKGSNSCNY